jgi:hypothetical protein
MKVRVLAAAAVAVWSKTAAATTAAVLPGMVKPVSASVGNTASAAWASAGTEASAATSCGFWDDMVYPPPGTVEVAFKSRGTGCVPGTLSLQASSDGTHWKTIASEHETTTELAYVSHACLQGAWLYQGQYTTDDQSFKSTSPRLPSAPPFTC